LALQTSQQPAASPVAGNALLAEEQAPLAVWYDPAPLPLATGRAGLLLLIAQKIENRFASRFVDSRSRSRLTSP